jgi:hypothetical protein
MIITALQMLDRKVGETAAKTSFSDSPQPEWIVNKTLAFFMPSSVFVETTAKGLLLHHNVT